jgi:CRISPR-associated endonuclease/helicase Cas3
MPYLAHTENPNGQSHLLRNHLREVGNLSSDFASQIDPSFNEAARWAGLLHDLGKYRDEFQEYLLGKRKGGEDTHHAVYGAGMAFELRSVALAYAIAGHHAGLHDAQGLVELLNKSGYKVKNNLKLLREKFEAELGKLTEKINEPDFVKETDAISRFKTDLFVRMIFSALVDADFLDTEAHYEMKARPRVPALNEDNLSEKLLVRAGAAKERKADEALRSKKNPEIITLRNAIYEQCLTSAEKEQGFFSLTVPTGGGKTLSGMAFALAHARKHNLRRIIVVIPYLSIIEQNAAEYRQILDPTNQGIVVENHSAIAIAAEDKEEKQTSEAKERSPLVLAAENWDAPIIVTTSVQFIESLFSNKPSRCRKLHNIARSVVLFDEVQTLPARLLEPLLSMWRELRDEYGVSFVFSSATQPAFRKQTNLKNGFTENELTEITENTAETFKQLRRVRFELPRANERKTWAQIADEVYEHKQVVCVVNTRKQAFALWNELHGKLAENECRGLFHLSSALCAEHRFEIIGAIHNPHEGSVRWRLLNGLPCRVVSTQLVEAGVDLDFPLLYRALAPLDSIVQAAGRCNRENRLQELGRVVVFRTEDDSLPPGIYKLATEQTANMMSNLSEEQLATDPLLFADYFNRIYGMAATDYQRSGETTIQQDRQDLNFRSVAQKVKVIDDTGVSVIVPYGKSIEIVEEIRGRQTQKGVPRFNRDDLRRLQRFMVNIRRNDFLTLQTMGQIQELLPNISLYVLNEGSYRDALGVVIGERASDEFVL